MFLELVRLAGDSGLSIKITSIPPSIQAEIIDSKDNVLYSYSSSSCVDLANVLSDYINDPVAFTKRLSQSVPHVNGLIEELVIGV